MRMLATLSMDRAWQFVVAGLFSVALAGLIFYSVL
jgi:hypothetical protein